MGRRDYGSGQLRKVGEGKYRLRVSAGNDPVTGRRRVITETVFGTITEARRRLSELVAANGQRRNSSAAVTLGRIIDVWLEHGGHARATRVNYDRARSRIPDRLLATPAVKVTPYDIDNMYHCIAAAHGVHSTHQLHALVSGAYNNARRLRWVHDNPARDAWLPAIVKRPSTTPTTAQARRIVAAAADAEQKLWLRLALVLGRRRSEILALRWSDIDLSAKVVHVRRSLEQDRTPKPTKTGDEAAIAVDGATVTEIRARMKAQRERALAAGVSLIQDPWLFSQEPDSSLPWRPDLATRRWAATRKRAKVPTNIRLQDFRKANVTELIAGGVDIRTVAGRAGHDPAMSLGTYAGMADPANRRAATVIAKVLDG
jgi:integrase